jgi:hypothetical protein
VKKIILIASALTVNFVVFSQSNTSTKNTEITVLNNGVRVHKTNGVEHGKPVKKVATSVKKQINDYSLDECLNSIVHIEAKMKNSEISENEMVQYQVYLDKVNSRIKSIKSSK